MNTKPNDKRVMTMQTIIRTRSRTLAAWITCLCLLLGTVPALQAQTTNTWVGSNTVWGTSSAWSPANIPNAVDSVVTFNNTTNTINNPSSSVKYTVGTLNLTGGSTIGLAGANLGLNFQTSVGTPVINVYNNGGVYWYWTQSGTQGFTKLGGGSLTGRFSNTPNPFTGPINVVQGTLGLNWGYNLGNASSLTLSNGTTLLLQNSANASTAGINAVLQPFPVNLTGGGTVTLASSYVGQSLIIPGNVQSSSGTAVKWNGPGFGVLAGTNTLAGLTVGSGNLVISTATTNYGSITVAANATNGVLATVPGSSLTVSNLTLTGTNNSVLEFSGGWLGTPTVPMLVVTNQLIFVTNAPAPILLTGGGWQTGSAIPLLQFGSLANTNAAGVFGSFTLGALPKGFTAALVDGTASNQINLNISAIAPLVWSPSTANANWTAAGNWTLSGGATGQAYTETVQFGPAVVFDDSLAPAGPSIQVTNNTYLSPNSVVFNNSTHNYTLLGSGGIENNASVTLNGSGYVTNSQANTYFGNTVLNAGTLVLNNILALGAVGTNGGANAAFGTINFNGGTLQFTANNTNDYSSRFSTAANQAYSLNTGGKSVALATPLTSIGGSLTVAGNGLLTLKAASTYTGNTTNSGTLRLGIANALPVTTALSLGGDDGTSGTLDLAGFSQQLSGLTFNPNASAATITNSSKLSPAILVYNGGTSTFAGSIVDGTANGANGGQAVSLTVAGGALTLAGQNTYTNITTITNGAKLYVTGSLTSTNITVAAGSLLDVAGITYAVSPGASLNGIGKVNGNVEVPGLSAIQPDALGATLNHGTLTFSNNLTLDPAATCNLNVAPTAASANNDRLLVLGQLNANDPNGNTINIQGPAAPATLDTGTDYLLISSPNNTISGTFNAVPNWVGAKPANYAHYTVVTSANTVTLHYSQGVLLSGAGAVTPVIGTHQNYSFTVLVTPGTGSTGIGVTADFSMLGGAVQTFAHSGNVYNYTYDVPGSVAPGNYAVPFTVTDAQADSFNGYFYLTIVNGTLVWNGAAGNNNWSGLNWLNGATPDTSGDTGDALVFTGNTRLAPVMDNSYNVAAVTFSNSAGAFNITTAGNTLTLAANGVVENDSPATESLDVPINLTSGSQLNTPAGNLIVGALGGSSDGFAKNGSGNLTIDGAAGTCGYSGNTTLAGGTLAITNADEVLPAGTTVAFTAPATLDLGGHSQTVGNLNQSGLSGGSIILTNGNLTVAGPGVNLTANTTAPLATTIDLSGLNSLTQNAGSMTFYGSLAANSTVKLAQTNYLTLNALYLANGGLTAAAPSDTATLLLGQSNVFNISTIQLGGYHNASGTIAFNGGWSNPTLVLRGLNGSGSAVANFNIGVNNNGSNPAFSFDTRAGTIDAVVNNLYILNNNSGGGTWVDTLSLSNGIFTAGTIYMGYDNGSTAATGGSAVVNQNGGTMLAGNLKLNANTSTGIPSLISTYNLGFGVNGTGLLSAAAISIGATQPITNSSATLNFINGTIENYDPALGQADSLGVVNGGSTSPENLDIAGQAGAEVANNSTTLHIVLAATGTHHFYAESGYTITEEPSVQISGSGGLTASGPGLVILAGTNNYTGNTTAGAGTLEIVQPDLFWRSSVTVSNGAVLQLDFAGTNQIAALVINGVSQTPGLYNSSTHPGLLAGPGSLVVVPVHTNAWLTSLALNPEDNLTPAFATNVFAYNATNGSGVKPTVTVVNADVTATNQLILNGRNLQLLASGVPSLVITNLGPGTTNVLKVLVTAQDGVTTNLYVVNLTQITVNANPFTLTSSLGGGNLNLSWPADRLGWRLQVQTNAVTTGLNSVWYDWPNSTNLNSVSIPLNPGNPTVFFRMVYP